MMSAFERVMQRAWGLHRYAHFMDIGDNRFVVRFTSEWGWNHVMRIGPWHFDFNMVLLKVFDGIVRPSDMTFDSLDIWVRVLDLPMDMMNRTFGKVIGGWIGKYISVDVDDEGMAWGEELRIRVEIRVDQPLLRGVNVGGHPYPREHPRRTQRREKIRCTLVGTSTGTRHLHPGRIPRPPPPPRR
jgi:hypothetical protein